MNRDIFNEDPIRVIQKDLVELEEKINEIFQIYKDTEDDPLLQIKCKTICKELDESISKKLALLNILSVAEKDNGLKGIDTSPHRIRCTCFIGNGECKMTNCPFEKKKIN